MKIFNRMLLLLNICIVLCLIFLTGKVIWDNTNNKIPTYNTSKVLHNTKYGR